MVDTIQFFVQKGTVNPSVSASSDQSTPLRETQPQSQNQRNVVSYAHFKNQNRTTVIQVVQAKLQSKGGKIVEANVLFDGGRDLSFVAQDLVKIEEVRGRDVFIFWVRGCRVGT